MMLLPNKLVPCDARIEVVTGIGIVVRNAVVSYCESPVDFVASAKGTDTQVCAGISHIHSERTNVTPYLEFGYAGACIAGVVEITVNNGSSRLKRN